MDTNKKTKTRVSDVIPKSEVKKWQNGNIVTIDAGCDTGKSYFIKNVLYSKAKYEGTKILMLIHRTRCTDQFKIEIEQFNKGDTIDVCTYQSIEYGLIHGYDFCFDDYSYIVSDEFHYFVEDSGFNYYTDMSFDAIINYQKAVKVFMSATGDTMLSMIDKFAGKGCKRYHYSIPPDFSHIKSLKFFYKSNTLETLAYHFKRNNHKAIFFVQSVTEAHRLYEKFRDCSMFLCGKSSANGQKYYKDIDEDKVQKMLAEQKFDDLFLICTTCFDAGANIIDTDLHEIVVDVKNTSSLIQCVGRKRVQNPDDKINLYIKALSNKQIGGMQSKRVEGLKRAGYLLEYGTRAYVEKYSRKDNDIDKFHRALIYDVPMSQRNKNTCSKRVNMMIYTKYEMDIDEYSRMINRGYADYIGHIFKFGNCYNRYYRFYEEGGLMDYLEILATSKAVMLNADDKSTFIEKMNVKHDGKLLKSQNSLNAAMSEKKYPYRVEQFETSRMIDGKKKNFRSAWRIVKVEEKPEEGQIAN